MSANAQNSQSNSPSVQVLYPRVIEVHLVPLSEVEAFSHHFFWATFFLSIASAGLSALVSLVATGFTNCAFMILLLVVTLFLFVLFAVFTFLGVKRRGSLKNTAIVANAMAIGSTPSGTAAPVPSSGQSYVSTENRESRNRLQEFSLELLPPSFSLVQFHESIENGLGLKDERLRNQMLYLMLADESIQRQGDGTFRKRE